MTDPSPLPPTGPSGAGNRPGPPEDRSSPILLYDGLCGFCDGTVRFILRRDLDGSMRFAALQGPTARAILDRHPELAGVDSLILVEGAEGRETVSARSTAVLRIALYLGGAWAVLALARWVPVPVRDWAYTFFARHRHSLFGRYDECPLPPPDVRARFLP